jgi:transcriptional regulator with XRE-family HTH domain
MNNDLRPCRDCGTPDQRPSEAFSDIIDRKARDLGLTDAALAAKAGISPGYAWRLRRPDKTRCRPSLTVVMKLVVALDLTGDDLVAVITSAKVGVGHDTRAVNA